MQSNPKTMANEALKYVNTKLTKYDEACAKLSNSLAELHRSADAAMEQERTLEAMDNSPPEIRRNVKDMIKKAVFRLLRHKIKKNV